MSYLNNELWMSYLNNEQGALDTPNNSTGFPLGAALTTLTSGAKIYQAVNEDSKNNSTRNTVETGANVISGLIGGLLGGWLGEYIGEQVKPGEGKKTGELIGSIIGGYTASLASDAIVSSVLDSNQCGIDDIECEVCDKIFSARIYKGEKICSNCKSY